MTVRYERRGLRVVRVDGAAPAWPAAPPPDRPEAPPPVAAWDGEDYRVRLHRFAEAIRGAVARYRLSGDAVTGAHVREARRLVRIGQRDLARELRIARSSIADCEGGRRRVHPRLAAWTREVLRPEGPG
jgi:hypothetical protein